MSDRNPNFHSRRSIRLKGYDYSQAGLYFITLCVQNRDCLFGEIVGTNVGAILRDRLENPIDNSSKGDHEGSPQRGSPQQKMELNDAGKMIAKWYDELENKYPNIRCHEYVVMPNHFHCIIEITDAVVPEWDAHVGAPLRGRPIAPYGPIASYGPNTPYGPDNKKYNPVIGHVVGWFKTMTTNEYIHGVKNRGWKRFDGKLWQRNYWEHIIRDDGSYNHIAEYINENPSKWNNDRLNPDQKL